MIYIASAAALVLTLVWGASTNGRAGPFISGVIGLALASALLGIACLIEAVAAGVVRDLGDAKYSGIPFIVGVAAGLPGALLGTLILLALRRYRKAGRS
jgi:hypothetical protein